MPRNGVGQVADYRDGGPGRLGSILGRFWRCPDSPYYSPQNGFPLAEYTAAVRWLAACFPPFPRNPLGGAGTHRRCPSTCNDIASSPAVETAGFSRGGATLLLKDASSLARAIEFGLLPGTSCDSRLVK